MAFRLFGGVDVVGNFVNYLEKKYEITDVIDSSTPLLVYEIQTEDLTKPLNRAVIRCIQNSQEWTANQYCKLAGEWTLVDYSIIYYLVKLLYFAIPWIVGMGLLILIKKYKKEAKRGIEGKEKEILKWNSNMKRYWRQNKEWMIWEGIFWTVFILFVIITVVQINIPQSMIPDKWSNFEFWSQYWEGMKSSTLVLRRMPKGIPDLEYMGNLYKSIIFSIVSIINAGVIIKLMYRET